MVFQIGIGIAITISISKEDRDRDFGDRGHALNLFINREALNQLSLDAT